MWRASFDIWLFDIYSQCRVHRGNYQRIIVGIIIAGFIFLASLKMRCGTKAKAAKQLRRIEGPCNTHLQ